MGIRKKICFLVGYYPIARGGAEYQALLIAESLKDEFDLFFISTEHNQESSYHENGFKIYTLKVLTIPKLDNIYFYQRRKLMDILQHERPDIIYHRALTANIGVAARYCQSNSSKLVWHIASISDLKRQRIVFNQNILFNFLEFARIKYGISNSSSIIAQTQEQSELLNNRYKRKSTQVYNFHPLPVAKIEKSNSVVKILWIANFKPLKQHHLFVDIAKEFSSESNVKFIMMGRPGIGRYSEANIRESISAVKNIEYLGELPIDEVNQYLATSHLLINTSKFEGFSNTFVQAWFHEVPVLSLNVDPDNIISSNQIGFCSGTMNIMMKQIKDLLGDLNLLSSMGRKARKFAIDELSTNNLHVIKSVLNEEHSTPSCSVYDPYL